MDGEKENKKMKEIEYEILKEIYSTLEASEEVKRYYLSKFRECVFDALMYASFGWMIGRGLEIFIKFPELTFSVWFSLASAAYAFTKLPDLEHYYKSKRARYESVVEIRKIQIDEQYKKIE